MLKCIYFASVSGSVHDIGDKAAAASGLKVGDSVCALVGGGGYAGLINQMNNILSKLLVNSNG